MLYAFARLHPGVGYVQGMNEAPPRARRRRAAPRRAAPRCTLGARGAETRRSGAACTSRCGAEARGGALWAQVVAPLYYVFKLDPVPDFSAGAEADAFWCFGALFEALARPESARLGCAPRITIEGPRAGRSSASCTTASTTAAPRASTPPCGAAPRARRAGRAGAGRAWFRVSPALPARAGPRAERSARRRLGAILRRADPQVAQHLLAQGLPPTLYALRWIALVLCQEFDLPDVLRIWDSVRPRGSRHALRPAEGVTAGRVRAAGASAGSGAAAAGAAAVPALPVRGDGAARARRAALAGVCREPPASPELPARHRLRGGAPLTAGVLCLPKTLQHLRHGAWRSGDISRGSHPRRDVRHWGRRE